MERSLVDAVLDDRRLAALARSTADGDGEPRSPDDAAAERLLRRKMPALLREPDPRRRRQRAYGLLARHGFSPDVCNVVARRVTAEACCPRGCGRRVRGRLTPAGVLRGL